LAANCLFRVILVSRLCLLGVVEARLADADDVIVGLSGLNTYLSSDPDDDIDISVLFS
jgi:hypothetical protein